MVERQPPKELVAHARASGKLFNTVKFDPPKILAIKLTDIRSELTKEQRAVLPRLRDTGKYTHMAGMEFQKPFDVVILSLGWVYDASVFKGSKGLKFKLEGHPKRPKDQNTYPALTAEYESISAPNLFVIGAAAHGLDRFRYKASGGFIHGFRFTTRSLFRILETRYEHPEQPYSQPPIQGGYSARFPWSPKSRSKELKAAYEADFGANTTDMMQNPLWGKLIHRLNNAAGPYEMVGGSLSDVILYDCEKGETHYMEDLPEDVIHDRYLSFARVAWSYYYGTSDVLVREKSLLCGVRSSRTALIGSFIHPVLQYYPANQEPLPSYMWKNKPTIDHPSVYWPGLEGVSRVHLPDQFVWGDWADVETLGLLKLFMLEVEHAVAQQCKGKSNGRIQRKFDEDLDSNYLSKEFTDKLGSLPSECRGGGF